MFDRRMIGLVIAEGMGLFVVTLAAFLISLYRGQDAQDARAISYTTLILGNLGLIWASRSRTRSLRQTLRAPNTPLWAITAGTLVLLAGILYIPSIRVVFQFSQLHLNDLAVCTMLLFVSLAWFELLKLRMNGRNLEQGIVPSWNRRGGRARLKGAAGEVILESCS